MYRDYMLEVKYRALLNVSGPKWRNFDFKMSQISKHDTVRNHTGPLKIPVKRYGRNTPPVGVLCKNKSTAHSVRQIERARARPPKCSILLRRNFPACFLIPVIRSPGILVWYTVCQIR